MWQAFIVILCCDGLEKGEFQNLAVIETTGELFQEKKQMQWFVSLRVYLNRT